MRGRKPTNFNPDAVITSYAECPNCQCTEQITYIAKKYAPPYFITCTFCETKFKWTKTKTVEVIPAQIRYQMLLNGCKQSGD